jgi:putative DNA primase/helicase
LEVLVSDVIVPDPSAKLDCAVAYIARGWHIFVLKPDKTPFPNCVTCKEAGPGHDMGACKCLTCHGFYAATLERNRIEMMLTLYPEGVIAVRTGEKSNIIVIDAESDSDNPALPSGVEVLDDWENWVNATWVMPPTLTAITVSGGVHRYYSWVSGVRSRNRVLPNVDIKSDGGYVLVPCGDGPRRWLDGPETPVAPTEPLVGWLRTANRMSWGGPGGSATRGEGYDYQRFVREGCPAGVRDEFFNDMCFRLRKSGATIGEATTELRRHWSKVSQPPEARWFMPWEHVEYKVHRVWETVAPDPTLPRWTPTATVTPPPPPLPVITPEPEPVKQDDEAELISELEPDVEESEHVELVVEEPAEPEGPSDTGNALRFIRLFGRDLRYVTKMRRWLMWNGNRWVTDDLNTVMEMTGRLSADIRRQAEITQDTDEARVWSRWALSSESLRSRGAIIALAGTDPRISTTVDALDRNPLLLVVKNGVLDLRTGELVPALRDDLNTRSADVIYDRLATCPRWRDHIKFVTKGDVLLAAYLRRAVGYTLTGLVREQTFFMLEGAGDNGKNAFIEPIIALLGQYAQTGTSALITGGDEQHPTILADLIGARLVFIDEARQGKPLNVERVKQLTGSKRVKARRMGQDFFEFDAQLKLWIAGNNHPTMRDPSDGIWRRLHRVMFLAKIPRSKKIGDYGQILFEEEASGILNWALEGLKDWQQLNGLGEPSEVQLATTELRDEEDLVKQWLEERCIHTGSEKDRVTNAELYSDFCIWATLAGIPQSERPNRTQFGRELSGKGYARWTGRVGGVKVRGFEGVVIQRMVG